MKKSNFKNLNFQKRLFDLLPHDCKNPPNEKCPVPKRKCVRNVDSKPDSKLNPYDGVEVPVNFEYKKLPAKLHATPKDCKGNVKSAMNPDLHASNPGKNFICGKVPCPYRSYAECQEPKMPVTKCLNKCRIRPQ